MSVSLYSLLSCRKTLWTSISVELIFFHLRWPVVRSLPWRPIQSSTGSTCWPQWPWLSRMITPLPFWATMLERWSRWEMFCKIQETTFTRCSNLHLRCYNPITHIVEVVPLYKQVGMCSRCSLVTVCKKNNAEWLLNVNYKLLI